MPAITNIPGLPVATGLIGTELFWAVQNGLDVSVTAAQIVALTGGGGGGGGIGNLQPVFGVVIANGTSAPLVTDAGIAGQVLTSNGTGFAPTYQPAPSGTVAGGGTGLNILNPVGGVLIANGVNPINITTAGTTGQVLTSNGTGIAPSFQNASSSSGTVPNGGTGQSTLTTHAVLIGEGTSPINQVGPGTAGQLLTSNGASLDPSFQPLPTITVAGGGTGLTTLFAHGLLVGAGTSNVVSVSPGTANQVLVSNGASADPTFQNLPTITVPSGGTGTTTLTNHGVLIGQGTSAVNVSSAGTAGQVLTSNGASADPTFQAIPIPSIDVAHGGTGVATLTSHGVLIGQGTSAVHITSAGTAGQVLTSNGASADPTYQASYPPGPIPDLATWMQAIATAGEFGNWIWGDVTLTSPIVVTYAVQPTQNTGFDFHGAKIICNMGTNTVDMLTLTISSASIGVDGFQLRNGTFIGSPNYLSGSPTPGCRDVVVISSTGNGSGMFGMSIRDCAFIYGGQDGLKLGGDVFECDVSSCFMHGNVRAGCNLHNYTNIAGSGVISSINFIGGDYRENEYGILADADVTFTEPGGFNVDQSNFIVNLSSGIWCGPGFQSGNDLHFENNCNGNLGDTNAAITSVFGPVNLTGCQAPSSNSSPQHYLGDLGSANPVSQQFFMNSCTCFNEDTNANRQYAAIRFQGVMYLDQSMDPGRVDLTGGGATWQLIGGMGSCSLPPTPVTAATYTLLSTDTDVIANRAGTVTLTLPAPLQFQSRSIYVKTIQAQTVVSASSNVVPLIGGSAGTAILAGTAGKWAELVSDGAANWIIMAGN